MKGGHVQNGRGVNHHHHHHHHNHHNHHGSGENNNATSSSPSVKEASRRLNAILKTAKKLLCSPEDLARLEAVKKLTGRGGGGGGNGGGWFRHGLSLAVGLVALLFVCLLVCSVEDHGFACLQNTSQTIKPIPVSQMPITTTRHSKDSSQDEERDRWSSEPIRQER